jgi:putative ABC transport system permease protein
MTFVGTFMQESYKYDFTGMYFLPKEWYLLGASVFIGFAAALIPAIQASRTDIAETLTNS